MNQLYKNCCEEKTVDTKASKIKAGHITDACPHCGAMKPRETFRYDCGTCSLLDRKASIETRTELCKEREARLRAKAEVAKTNETLAIVWADFEEMMPLKKKAEAEVKRLREFISNELQNKNSDLRDKLRRAIEIAKELDILGPYRVGGPFEIQEKLEQRAKFLNELAAIEATLNPTNK
jgi:hypothetical protein